MLRCGSRWQTQAVARCPDLRRFASLPTPSDGLILVAVLHEQDRFRVIVVGNAALPDPAHFDRMIEAQKNSPDPEAFTRWQTWAAAQDHMNVGTALAEGLAGVDNGARIMLTPDEIAAYDAPFPDARYQAGVLVFPALANITPDAMALYDAAWRVLENWQKPFVTAYGKADPVLGFFDTIFQEHVPGAKGPPHRQFPDGTHFIQEEEPNALVDAIVAAAAA
jgi:haloalkane dehalogenase